MLSTERQRRIIEELANKGEVSIPCLAKKFNVSVETIRRDINILANKDMLEKVHGGAVTVLPPIREDAYNIRMSQNVEAKMKIADYFAENIIKDNDRIVFSSGSTMEYIAKRLTAKNLTVVTNSIGVATILQESIAKSKITGEVILLGGQLSANENYLTGFLTLEMLKNFTFSKAILGCSAFNAKNFMTSNIDEGIIMSQMIERAGESYVAADSGKYGKNSTYKYAVAEKIKQVITENTN